MEAMAMELPCVTTFVNGIPELIEDNVDGLIVPPADVAALAQAIGKLAADPNLRLRLGKAGRTKVLRNYHLKTNASRLAEVWLQSLQQHAVEE
jgi:glycosyltransferase involved in cell wall biosynthesis